jgi:uncharacterized protein (TIGR04255 family)
VEAIVDIQVKLPATFDVTKLKSVHDLIREEYPEEEERRAWVGRIGVKDGEVLDPKPEYKGIEGYRYVSIDKKQIIQARLDRFAFSRLKPYETWKDLKSRASEHWQQYVKVASPEFITRTALRYINRLEFPIPINDFREYLVAPPLVPEGLPQEVGTFLTRIAIHKDEVTVALITQAMQSIKKDSVTIILDIDAFKQIQYDVLSDDVWDALEELHEFKNQVFFSSITQKTLELYE